MNKKTLRRLTGSKHSRFAMSHIPHISQNLPLHSSSWWSNNSLRKFNSFDPKSRIICFTIQYIYIICQQSYDQQSCGPIWRPNLFYDFFVQTTLTKTWRWPCLHISSRFHDNCSDPKSWTVLHINFQRIFKGALNSYITSLTTISVVINIALRITNLVLFRCNRVSDWRW